MNNIIIKIGVLTVLQGKLLLIKEKREHDDKYYWNIIKGTYEQKKDKSLIEAAKREAKEEAGIIVKNLQLFNVFEVRKKKEIIFQFNFLANIKNKRSCLASKDQQKKRNEDIIEIRFFDKKTLRKMKRKDFLGNRSYLIIQNWLTGGKEFFNLLRIK